MFWISIKVGKNGEMIVEESVMFATDACAKCGKRDVKLLRCSLCLKAPCESLEFGGSLIHYVSLAYGLQTAVSNVRKETGSASQEILFFGWD